MAALDSWVDGPTKSAIIDFVGRVTADNGADFVAPEERIAVFDNDGTMWCEKPAYIQLDFLMRRFAEQAQADPSLRDQQPYRASIDNDLGWFGAAITGHYEGDDSMLEVLTAAVASAHATMRVDEHADRVADFFATAHHPTLDRLYISCTYAPMIELLRYLEAHGFTNYIASGGGRDFMRPVAGTVYGIPPERVIGSSVGLEYTETEGAGNLLIGSSLEVLDDGPEKPIRIWSRIGRRPILAAGNSDGDIPMLCYTGGQGGPALRLLVCHDDPDREFAYTAGAEKALEYAGQLGWHRVSMREDWRTVFSD